jgi:hypothetical protein
MVALTLFMPLRMYQNKQNIGLKAVLTMTVVANRDTVLCRYTSSTITVVASTTKA